MKAFFASLTVLAGLMPISAFGAALEARIDLSDQKMRVYRNGGLLYSWKISTARSGYVTPTGSYKPTRMHKMWHSRKYNMSPMPHSIFFRGGYAIHGTNKIKYLWVVPLPTAVSDYIPTMHENYSIM